MVPTVKYPRYLYSTWGNKEMYTLSKIYVYIKAVGNARVGVGLSEVLSLSQTSEITFYTPIYGTQMHFSGVIQLPFRKRIYR